jgi:hypothetical protein
MTYKGESVAKMAMENDVHRVLALFLNYENKAYSPHKEFINPFLRNIIRMVEMAKSGSVCVQRHSYYFFPGV